MFRTGAICLVSGLLACSSSGNGGDGGGGGDGGAGGDGGSAPLPRSSGGVRLILTQDLIAKLQKRAAAGDANWMALKARCDALATGKVIPPSGDLYPSDPDIGAGYAGEEYRPVLYDLALCFRVADGVDAASAMKWGAQGAALLDAMALPESAGGYKVSTDSGYGIRNFGVGLAFGYDWLYPALSADQRKHITDALASWIDWYDQNGFIHNQPIGNYFEGYFLTKVAATLATLGELPEADAWWNDVQSRMWGQLVQPAFSKGMAGGGWPEGWEYGPLSVVEVLQALRCATTAKQLDWEKQLPQAHDQAMYQLHFSWPSLKHMDDQGLIRSGPIIPDADQAFMQAGLLDQLGDGFAPTAHAFALAVQAANPSPAAVPWVRFLFDDPAAATSPIAMQPLSYLAPGPGHVAMRSSWDTNATWALLASGTYLDAGDSGEQLFGQGSVVLVKGDSPLIVNAAGWVPQLDAGGEQVVYDDAYSGGGHRLYNVFFVDDANNPYNPGQDANGPDVAHTHVERFEDGGGFVRARGAQLEQMYSGGVITQWTRDVAFLRPDALVVYDRTTVADASKDRWLSFHLPSMPAANGNRWDVAGQVSLASMSPGVTGKIVALPITSVTRVELHAPAGSASNDWVTVATVGNPSMGTVQGSGVAGAYVVGTRMSVAVFPSDHAGTGTLSSAQYTVAQHDGDHFVFDVAPGSYAITATAASSQLTVTIASGGSFSPSSNGTLSFKVAQDGTVTK